MSGILVISKLSYILTRRDTKLLFILVLFSIFVSLIEVIGVSAIMPFISVAVDFENIHINKYYTYIYNLFNLDTDIQFVLLFGFTLILFYFLRSVINIYYNYSMVRFSQGRYNLIVSRLLKNYLGMQYKDFVKRNSSSLTKTIITEANNLTKILTSSLFIMSEVLIVILIYSMMLYVDYKITLLLTLFLLISAVVMLKTISKKIKKQGIGRAKIQETFYEIISKSFANFKLIKLQTNDDKVLNEFSNASYGFVKTNIIAQTLLHVPRLILEAISFSIVILIVLYLVWKYQNNISGVLSILSMFVLALYRLMPSINRIVTNYNSILFELKALDIVYDDLIHNVENLGSEKIKFDNKISLENIVFEYEIGKNVLNNIDLTITKGSKIAFIGESGSGKSTLVDMIIGLYQQKEGTIRIDNVALDYTNLKDWRKKVGYIPQSVYLFDGTVGDNIVFGSNYSEDKINECLKQAKIFNFLQNKQGLHTIVGEGGVMLSGGQKQRIAIARALYTDPEILVLDEATSALDDATELEIMNEIYSISEDKTLIIIAHRLSTIQRCEIVYKLQDGKIINE